MRGLVPRIHVFLATRQRRGWPGHIGERSDAVLLTAIGERSDAVLLTAMGERSDAVLLTAMPGHDGAESQIPNTSLKNRAIDPCDCVLARSSSAFFGVEKPCLVPL